MQAIWGHIWKRTVVKNQTNAANVTMHYREVEKIAESGQLGNLFLSNSHLAQCSANFPRISEKFNLEEKNEEEKGEKGKKLVALVC